MHCWYSACGLSERIKCPDAGLPEKKIYIYDIKKQRLPKTLRAMLQRVFVTLPLLVVWSSNVWLGQHRTISLACSGSLNMGIALIYVLGGGEPLKSIEKNFINYSLDKAHLKNDTSL